MAHARSSPSPGKRGPADSWQGLDDQESSAKTLKQELQGGQADQGSYADASAASSQQAGVHNVPAEPVRPENVKLPKDVEEEDSDAQKDEANDSMEVEGAVNRYHAIQEDVTAMKRDITTQARAIRAQGKALRYAVREISTNQSKEESNKILADWWPKGSDMDERQARIKKIMDAAGVRKEQWSMAPVNQHNRRKHWQLLVPEFG